MEDLKFTTAGEYIMLYNRDWMTSALKETIVNLSFEKVKDGSIREMKATLNSELIPEDKMPKTESSVQVTHNEDILRVFDLDLNEWRSFRIDKVISFDSA